MNAEATLIMAALTVVSSVVAVLFRQLLAAHAYQVLILERELTASQQREARWAAAARESTTLAGEAVGAVRETRRRS